MSKDRASVFITGGAGSLGKVFVSHLVSDYRVTVVDNNEALAGELKQRHPQVEIVLGDFSEYPQKRYDYYLHLAAYKHVDLGETDPWSFAENNINNTARFYENIQKPAEVLYISTDKAVEPISVYGMTKAIAERLTAVNGWSVARLGNLFGSSGSVVPIWEKAIERQAPVKITDERMTRFFIRDIPAAVAHIWDAFVAGEKLIIPPMGEPVRLMDVLTEMLAHHGYNSVEEYPGGVEIIGLRPGERLHEKIKWDREA